MPILFYLVSDLEVPVSSPVFSRKPDFSPHPHFPHTLASNLFYLLSHRMRVLISPFARLTLSQDKERGSPALSDGWKNLKEWDTHLRSSIDVQHQGFILWNHKPCLVPSFSTLLHVVQETADDAVLSGH